MNSTCVKLPTLTMSALRAIPAGDSRIFADDNGRTASKVTAYATKLPTYRLSTKVVQVVDPDTFEASRGVQVTRSE